MDFINQFSKIETDDSLMETVSHGNDAYPFSYYYENLALFDFNCVDWHWHNELEFVYIESGDVAFDVGDSHFMLSTGQGIMINSKVLHKLHSESDAIIPNFLFKPSFIAPADSLIYEKYVKPILVSSLDYIIFSENIAWQLNVIEIMKKIITLQNTDCNREISVAMLIQQLWIQFLDNLSFKTTEDKSAVVSRTRLQLMMQYINNHYSENISLEDIAKSASISKSLALHLFRDNIKETPVNYLINYRLKQGAMLLVTTEKKVATISSDVGFNNVDHFCRSFKKAYGVTPSEYRQQTTTH